MGKRVAVLAVVCLGCGEQAVSDIRDRLPDTLAVSTFEVVVDPAAERLLFPMEIKVFSPRRFAVLDGGLNRVVVFDFDGTPQGHFGSGEGDGPGEWREPGRLDYAQGVFVVTSRDHSAVNVYSQTGEPIQRSAFAARYRRSSYQLLADDLLLLSTGGHEDALAILTPLADIGTVTARIGEPVAALTGGRIDFEQTRIDIAEGRLPAGIANNALVAGTAEEVYLLLNAAGDLRKYDAAGELLWNRSLPEAMLEPIRTRAVEANRSLPAGSHAFAPIDFALRVRFHQGLVYILGGFASETEPRQHFAVFDSDGALASFHRLETDGELPCIILDFDLLPDGGILFIDALNARLLKARLPG